MTCPQCQHRVPAKALWTTSGFASVTCPHCAATLSPKPLTALLLFVLSIGLGDAALVLLRKNGAGLLLASAGFFLVCAAVFAVLLGYRWGHHLWRQRRTRTISAGRFATTDRASQPAERSSPRIRSSEA